MGRGSETSPPAVPRGDRAGTAATVACFSLSLAIASVAIPILMVRAGYTLAEVGFFTALAAVAQIAIRSRLRALMRRVADKHLVAAAAVLMAAGSVSLAATAATGVLVVAQLLQGAARGLFWTGIQTHAVRGSRPAAQGLASVNVASGLGLIVGPGLAGVLLETSAQLAMQAATAAAAAALVPVSLMARLPVFPPMVEDCAEDRVSGRAGVRAGSMAAAVAGAWRGLMGAYVPVALHQAAHSSTWIGGVVAVANAATIAAGWSARWVRDSQAAASLAAGVLGAGVGLAVFGASAQVLVAATVALVVSGLGMGLLQTLGPAVAADTVGEHERGDAMAAVGLYRAGATFVAPFGVAALVLVMPLGWALISAGAVIALPAGYLVRLRGR